MAKTSPGYAGDRCKHCGPLVLRSNTMDCLHRDDCPYAYDDSPKDKSQESAPLSQPIIPELPWLKADFGLAVYVNTGTTEPAYLAAPGKSARKQDIEGAIRFLQVVKDSMP